MCSYTNKEKLKIKWAYPKEYGLTWTLLFPIHVEELVIQPFQTLHLLTKRKLVLAFATGSWRILPILALAASIRACRFSFTPIIFILGRALLFFLPQLINGPCEGSIRFARNFRVGLFFWCWEVMNVQRHDGGVVFQDQRLQTIGLQARESHVFYISSRTAPSLWSISNIGCMAKEMITIILIITKIL